MLCETSYDKLQPLFGQENLQLQLRDTDSFVLSVNTEDTIKDLKKLEELFDFSSLSENHELFSKKKTKKLFAKLKEENLKNFGLMNLFV